MLNHANLFVPIYVGSDIWQNVGWNCIIYLSALTSIDTELYEAARIDGANRWQQTLHVTLPGILGTVVLLLILRVGSLMNVGYEKVILLYNEGIYETADVIQSYVYRRGLVQGDYSYSTAIGLFNSLVNVILVVSANAASKRVAGMGLFRRAHMKTTYLQEGKGYPSIRGGERHLLCAGAVHHRVSHLLCADRLILQPFRLRPILALFGRRFSP